MVWAELGSGQGGFDTINVFGVRSCSLNCSWARADAKFVCNHHNGTAVATINGTPTHSSVQEFERGATCFQPEPAHPEAVMQEVYRAQH